MEATGDAIEKAGGKLKDAAEATEKKATDAAKKAEEVIEEEEGETPGQP